MITMLLFSVIAAALVALAGRGDNARDPRLTVLALGLLAIFPLLGFLPKLEVLPTAEGRGQSPGFPWMDVLFALWAVGFSVAAVRLGIAARGISAWRKRSLTVEIVNGVEIRQLPGLNSPVAAGVFRPVIFVPEEWNSWSAATRKIVLNHEMAHHYRRDPLWRWVAEVACAINGLNPLVVWMSRRLTVQCEFACDSLVLSQGVSAADYARVLCDVAEDRVPYVPVLAMAATSSLESRVRRMLNPRQRRGSAGLFALIALTLICAGGLASLDSRKDLVAPVPQSEIDLRWSANPFPGEK